MLIYLSEADFNFKIFIVVKFCRNMEFMTSKDKEFSSNLKQRKQLLSMLRLAY